MIGNGHFPRKIQILDPNVIFKKKSQILQYIVHVLSSNLRNVEFTWNLGLEVNGYLTTPIEILIKKCI